MESDWKKFREITPKLRERYLSEQNARILKLLTDPKKTETERFWDSMEKMKEEAKTLQHCLDGHSRSRMPLLMASMIHVGMLKKEDMAQFSQELQGQLERHFAEGDLD